MRGGTAGGIKICDRLGSGTARGRKRGELPISGLLSGLHKYGAEAFLIPAAYAEEKTLAQILKENGLKPEEGLALVATDASLAQTAGLPIATVAFLLHPAFPGQTPSFGTDPGAGI